MKIIRVPVVENSRGKRGAYKKHCCKKCGTTDPSKFYKKTKNICQECLKASKRVGYKEMVEEVALDQEQADARVNNKWLAKAWIKPKPKLTVVKAEAA